MKLNWGMWLYGLLAGVIGGGAGSIVTAVTGNILLPNQVNTSAGLHTFMQFIYLSFVLHGVIAAAFYLKQSPLPPIETTVSVATTTQPGVQPKTTTTVETTMPVVPPKP